jgi:cell fate regulator YaaT (PSP1 superfamily)
VSVRFGPAGRTQTFLLAEPLEPRLRIGESIVIQTADGPAIGQVHPHPEALETRRSQPVAPAVPVRRVTAADLAERFKRDQHEREGRAYAMDRIRAHNLAMKLSRVEATLDGSRLIFYFTADERIDFRELVKELAARFRTRIEMRQIGVRDEARLLGGYGSCGRPLCCTTWLNGFELCRSRWRSSSSSA